MWRRVTWIEHEAYSIPNHYRSQSQITSSLKNAKKCLFWEVKNCRTGVKESSDHVELVSKVNTTLYREVNDKNSQTFEVFITGGSRNRSKCYFLLKLQWCQFLSYQKLWCLCSSPSFNNDINWPEESFEAYETYRHRKTHILVLTFFLIICALVLSASRNFTLVLLVRSHF